MKIVANNDPDQVLRYEVHTGDKITETITDLTEGAQRFEDALK